MARVLLEFVFEIPNCILTGVMLSKFVLLFVIASCELGFLTLNLMNLFKSIFYFFSLFTLFDFLKSFILGEISFALNAVL